MSNSGIFPDDNWAIAQGQTDSGPLFLRYRKGDPSPADQERFCWLVFVRWAYEPRDGSGLPDSATMASMDEFEDCILDASDRDAWWGSGVAVKTHGGAREWRFYTPDVEAFQREFSEALHGLGPYPLELQVFEDPDWIGLAELRDAAA